MSIRKRLSTFQLGKSSTHLFILLLLEKAKSLVKKTSRMLTTKHAIELPTKDKTIQDPSSCAKNTRESLGRRVLVFRLVHKLVPQSSYPIAILCDVSKELRLTQSYVVQRPITRSKVRSLFSHKLILTLKDFPRILPMGVQSVCDAVR